MSDLLSTEKAAERKADEEAILAAAAAIKRKRQKRAERAVRDFPLFKTPKQLTEPMIAKLKWRLALPGGTTERELVAAVVQIMESLDKPDRPVTSDDLGWLRDQLRRQVVMGRIDEAEAEDRLASALQTMRVDIPLSEAEASALKQKQAEARPAREKWAAAQVAAFLREEVGEVIHDEFKRPVGLGGGREPGAYVYERRHYKRV